MALSSPVLNCFLFRRLRQAYRAVGFPLVQGADVASLGAADAVIKGQGTDRAEGYRFLFHGRHLKGIIHPERGGRKSAFALKVAGHRQVRIKKI